MDCLLSIEPAEAGGYEVGLRIDGGATVRARFAFDSEGEALKRSFNDLMLPNCARDHIKGVGQQLFLDSFPRELRDELRRALNTRIAAKDTSRVRLRLIVPANFRWLPWEALFDDQLLHLGLRTDWTVRHEPPAVELDQIAFPGSPGDKLKVLLVVPEQTNLDYNGERHAIKNSALRLGAAAAEFHDLQGKVTLARLAGKLAEGAWDVVHYIGHGKVELQHVSIQGRVEVQHRVKILLNPDTNGDDGFVDEMQFANCFMGSGTRLVVLSCCSSGNYSPSETRSLAGLGPYLLRAGVPAVVAMRYVVSDTAATEFSRAFYESLFHLERGQVDSAVQTGRRALSCLMLESERRAFITPVLYATEAGVNLPGLVPPKKEEPRPPPPPLRTRINLPEQLAELMSSGRCFVIAGEKLATVGATRDEAQLQFMPPTLDTLARQIADKTKPPYPRKDELTVLGGTSGGDEDRTWEVFERICQYFKSCPDPDGGRFALEMSVSESFSGRQAPALLRRIADWQIPGMFYTHFDGFLRDAVTQTGDWELAESPRGEISGNRRALVLLRGWPRESPTLRLTREDNWEVIDGIAHMSPSIKRLARERGRALLLLGVTPSDATVQFLVNTLLGDQAQRDAKPIFFACGEPEPVVKACWHRFRKLQWMGDQPLDELVLALDGLMRKKG